MKLWVYSSRRNSHHAWRAKHINFSKRKIFSKALFFLLLLYVCFCYSFFFSPVFLCSFPLTLSLRTLCWIRYLIVDSCVFHISLRCNFAIALAFFPVRCSFDIFWNWKLLLHFPSLAFDVHCRASRWTLSAFILMISVCIAHGTATHSGKQNLKLINFFRIEIHFNFIIIMEFAANIFFYHD